MSRCVEPYPSSSRPSLQKIPREQSETTSWVILDHCVLDLCRLFCHVFCSLCSRSSTCYMDRPCISFGTFWCSLDPSIQSLFGSSESASECIVRSSHFPVYSLIHTAVAFASFSQHSTGGGGWHCAHDQGGLHTSASSGSDCGPLFGWQLFHSYSYCTLVWELGGNSSGHYH